MKLRKFIIIFPLLFFAHIWLSTSSANEAPTVVSLCSGLGVTDRIFHKTGFQIIVSADIDPERTKLNTLNNLECLKDISKKYPIITGDITQKTTQEKILAPIKQFIQDGKEIDLIYSFIPKLNNIDSSKLIKATYDITVQMEPHFPKLICLEMLSDKSSSWFHKATSYPSYITIQKFYTLNERNVKFSDYNLPIKNKRAFKVFVRSDLYTGPVKIQSLPSLFPTPTYKAKGIKQAFEEASQAHPELPVDWWAQEIPYLPEVPLHVETSNLSKETKLILNTIESGTKLLDLKCSNLQTEKQTVCDICMICQFKEQGKTKFRSFIKRYKEEEALASLTTRFKAWYEGIHIKAPRGFTLFELAVLNGLTKMGNFTLNTSCKQSTSHLIQLITAPTSPEFLYQLFPQFYQFCKGYNPIIEESLDCAKLPKFLYIGTVIPSAIWSFKLETPETIIQRKASKDLTSASSTKIWNSFKKEIIKKIKNNEITNTSDTVIELLTNIGNQYNTQRNVKDQRKHRIIEQGASSFMDMINLYLSIDSPEKRHSIDEEFKLSIQELMTTINSSSKTKAFSEVFSKKSFNDKISNFKARIEFYNNQDLNNNSTIAITSDIQAEFPRSQEENQESSLMTDSFSIALPGMLTHTTTTVITSSRKRKYSADLEDATMSYQLQDKKETDVETGSKREEHPQESASTCFWNTPMETDQTNIERENFKNVQEKELPLKKRAKIN